MELQGKFQVEQEVVSIAVILWQGVGGSRPPEGTVGSPGGTDGRSQTEITNSEPRSQSYHLTMSRNTQEPSAGQKTVGGWGSLRTGTLPKGCNLQEKG